jgi:hypothetical protein
VHLLSFGSTQLASIVWIYPAIARAGSMHPTYTDSTNPASAAQFHPALTG